MSEESLEFADLPLAAAVVRRGRVQAATPDAVTLLGVATDAVVGAELTSLVDADSRADVEALLGPPTATTPRRRADDLQVSAGGSPAHALHPRSVVVRLAGSHRPVELTVSALSLIHISEPTRPY